MAYEISITEKTPCQLERARAVKLANGEKTLKECSTIQQQKYSAAKEQLEKMLQPIKLEISLA